LVPHRSPRCERAILGKLPQEVAGQEPSLHLEDPAVADCIRQLTGP